MDTGGVSGFRVFFFKIFNSSLFVVISSDIRFLMTGKDIPDIDIEFDFAFCFKRFDDNSNISLFVVISSDIRFLMTGKDIPDIDIEFAFAFCFKRFDDNSNISLLVLISSNIRFLIAVKDIVFAIWFSDIKPPFILLLL